MSDVPLASYEDPRWFSSAANSRVGNRGHTGNPATFTTNMVNVVDNDLVISAKDCFSPGEPQVKVQFVILAQGAPAWLYEDGYPAMWSLLPATDLGFTILMKRAGMQGNYFTLTLVNPGRISPFKILRPAAKDIVIILAHAGGAAPTTTPAQLITAINSDLELGEYMLAFASSAIVAPLVAVPQRAFTGGVDVPGLELVSIGTSNLGVNTTTTGASVRSLLSGSRYVTATLAPGNATGAGIVDILPVTTLTAGTPNRGEVSDQFTTRRNAWTQRRRAGQPLGKEHNKTLQLRDSRFGAVRTYQRVPKQDRAVTVSRVQNHQTDWLAHATLG